MIFHGITGLLSLSKVYSRGLYTRPHFTIIHILSISRLRVQDLHYGICGFYLWLPSSDQAIHMADLGLIHWKSESDSFRSTFSPVHGHGVTQAVYPVDAAVQDSRERKDE